MFRPIMIAAAAATLTLGACGPEEIDAGEMETESTLSDVREDAAALAESTGEVMKEGMSELKEGAQDVGQMMKEAGAEMKDAVSSDDHNDHNDEQP